MFTMKKTAIIGFIFLGMVSAASALTYRDENNVIATKTIPFQITNGARVEQGVVKYEFSVRVLAIQTGSASTWDHPIDDRQCTINVFSSIIRNVCFTTILGEQSCGNKWSVPLPQSAKYTPIKANFLDYDPCNDYDVKMDALKRQVTVELSGRMPATYKKLLITLKSYWTENKVVVTYQN